MAKECAKLIIPAPGPRPQNKDACIRGNSVAVYVPSCWAHTDEQSHRMLLSGLLILFSCALTLGMNSHSCQVPDRLYF